MRAPQRERQRPADALTAALCFSQLLCEGTYGGCRPRQLKAFQSIASTLLEFARAWRKGDLDRRRRFHFVSMVRANLRRVPGTLSAAKKSVLETISASMSILTGAHRHAHRRKGIS